MPVYEPDHIEYAIVSGRIHIALEDGQLLPAFWSHPNIGGLFPGIVLIHDWWGITDTERHLSNMFAQIGYYVVVPDLYNGMVASTPQEAIRLVEELGPKGFDYVNTALRVLETHHRCNRAVAAIGLGMGGTLAYQAALTCAELEAAVVYYGFPQRFFGRFKDAVAPVLAIYGSSEPHVTADLRERLRAELAQGPLPHEFITLEGAGRSFFNPNAAPQIREYGAQAWNKTIAFLDKYLEKPTRPPERKAF